MTDRSQDFVRIELIRHAATLGDKGALIVSTRADPGRRITLPKSQIGAIEHVAPFGPRLSVIACTLPRWLARDRGLLETRDDATGELFGGDNG